MKERKNERMKGEKINKYEIKTCGMISKLNLDSYCIIIIHETIAASQGEKFYEYIQHRTMLSSSTSSHTSTPKADFIVWVGCSPAASSLASKKRVREGEPDLTGLDGMISYGIAVMEGLVGSVWLNLAHPFPTSRTSIYLPTHNLYTLPPPVQHHNPLRPLRAAGTSWHRFTQASRDYAHK